MWRTVNLDVVQILIGGLAFIVMAAGWVALPLGILFVVGETIELFTR